MKRSLALLAVALAVACSDQSRLVLPARPDLEIQDAAHSGGNPDFFFLPPLVPDPSSNPLFDAGAFNPHLSPVVEVCRWDPGCGAVVAQFTMTSGLGGETVRVSTTDQQYLVNWHTDLSSLNPALTYRIRVSAGGKELGFADVDVVSSGSQLKNVQTGEYIGLVNGRTLPIKFRIENGALCDPPGTSPCSSGTVNLATGGNVVVPTTGDRIDIPAQGTGPVVTITIQYCTGVNVSVPRFGPCLNITSDQSDLSFSPKATVSMCSLAPPQLAAAQADLLVLYRQHGDQLTALPNAPDHCATTIGSATAPPRTLVEAGWRWVQRVAAAVLGPPRLYATAPVLHLGAGGDTPGISNFQFGLPAQMAALPNTNGQTAAPGDTVPNPPGVIVTDTAGSPVTGALIHFLVTQGGGTVTPESVVTDTLGIARVTNWALGNAGANQLRAWAIGIRGPADSFPITPDTASILADTGKVLFNATAVPRGPTGWVLYGVNSADDGLSRIDVATGVVTFIARLSPDSTKWTTPVAMSTRVSDSTLFVWNNSDLVTTGVLLTVDRCTGRGTLVDSTTPPQGILQSLAMSPTDTLYGLSSELYRVSTTTGVKKLVGSLGSGLSAYAADFLGSVLYGASPGGTLFTVNTSTGAATVIGTLTPAVGTLGSLVAHPVTGTLIGSAFGGTLGNVIFDINPTTAAVSNIRSLTGGFAPQGMGFGPPCPPAGGAIRVDSVHIANDTLHIGGPAVSYTAFITNPGSTTVSGVALQTWIDQGAASRAGGGLLTTCTTTLGNVPPGTCAVTFTILASNSTAGSGTLVPGLATARFELNQGGPAFGAFTLPVLLAP